MSPGPGRTSAPASSACSTRSAGRSPASSAAAKPLSRAASLAKVVQPSMSRRSTLTWANSGLALPGSTTADAIASSTTIAPSRPVRASARAATRSPASTVSSSKERTRARPHQVELRAAAPRTRDRRGSTIGSGMNVGRARRDPERDEVAQLLVAQLGQRHLAGAEHGLREAALVLKQLPDPVLDGALGDEPVDLDCPHLADPVGAVGGLVLDSGVPPAVEVDDVVGTREVEAGAARLEREQEHRCGTVLELAHHLLARPDRGA